MNADTLSEPSKVRKVKSEHEKGLVECLQKIRQWEKFKEDYEKLQERLKTLPDKLNYDTVVKFGNQAFVPGVIVDTNNITVLLGDNWFAEVSAKQAVQISTRRIRQCENTLSSLNKEKKQFENWLGFISDATDHEFVEITEKYDPEEEKLWREQHTERLREHRKQVAEEKKDQSSVSKNDTKPQNEGEGDQKSDEYYFNRLNELELEEENNGESGEDLSLETDDEKEDYQNAKVCEGTVKKSNLKQSVTEISTIKTSFRNSTNENKASVECREESRIESCKSDPSVNNTIIDNGFEVEREKSTKSTESNDPVNVSDQANSNCNASSNGDQEKHSSSDKHVRWIDLSEEKSKLITFTHSKPIPMKTNKKNRRRRSSSTSEPTDDESHDEKTPPLINSPSDIYKCFSYSIKHSKPKSILKTMHSTSSTESIMSGEFSDSAGNEEEGLMQNDGENTVAVDKSPSPEVEVEKAFTGEVRESIDMANVSKPSFNESRPKSLFKASRQRCK